jgi:hypothetical protein
MSSGRCASIYMRVRNTAAAATATILAATARRPGQSGHDRDAAGDKAELVRLGAAHDHAVGPALLNEVSDHLGQDVHAGTDEAEAGGEPPRRAARAATTAVGTTTTRRLPSCMGTQTSAKGRLGGRVDQSGRRQLREELPGQRGLAGRTAPAAPRPARPTAARPTGAGSGVPLEILGQPTAGGVCCWLAVTVALPRPRSAPGWPAPPTTADATTDSSRCLPGSAAAR